jgi:hypothetical protein
LKTDSELSVGAILSIFMPPVCPTGGFFDFALSAISKNEYYDVMWTGS